MSHLNQLKMDVDLTGARVLDLLVTGTSFLVGEAAVNRKRKKDAHLKDDLLCVIDKTIDIQVTGDRSNMLTGVLRVAIAKLELAKSMAGFGEVSRQKNNVTADKRRPFILFVTVRFFNPGEICTDEIRTDLYRKKNRLDYFSTTDCEIFQSRGNLYG
jgi:hypothetical protein